MAGFQNISSAGGGLPSVLPSAGSLPYLHRALGQVQANVQDRTILMIGDSITEGVFADLGFGPIATMLKYLNGAGINSQFGLSGPITAAILGTDARWANGTGWTLVNPATQPTGWGGVGCAYNGAPAAAGNLTYTPGTNSNQYDVYYFDGSAPEGFTCTATGGGGTVVTTGNTGLMKKATCIAATTSSSNVVTISAPTGLGCFIYGVEARLSTTATLRVGNVGAPGSTTTTWTSVFNASPSGSSMIGSYAPDVSVIGSGINDLNTGIPVSTYLANLTTLANVCKASGDVIFWPDIPFSLTDQPAALQTAYAAALKGFCAANGYGFLDTYTAWGTATKFNTLNGLGYYADLLVHPTSFGQADLGRILGQGLLSL